MNKIFPILPDAKIVDEGYPLSEQDVFEIMSVIKQRNLTEIIQGLIIVNLDKHARTQIAPQFWNYFKCEEIDKDLWTTQFSTAVDFLFNSYKDLEPLAHRLDTLRKNTDYTKPIYPAVYSAPEAVKIIIRASLLAQIPLDYGRIVEHFYQTGLNIEDPDNESHLEDCDKVLENNACCSCLSSFYETNRKLIDLGVQEKMAGQILTTIVSTYVEKYVEKTCKDAFGTYFMDSLENWLHSVVIAWIKKIYSYGYKLEVFNEIVEKFSKNLSNFMNEKYTKLRISELFNIVIEYPESVPALVELRTALARTDLRAYLVRSLRAAVETRLLHPGVSTGDILTAYVAAVRSVRVLDASGLLLEAVTHPVHQYLRSREDTIRCVVTSLTEENNSEIAEELTKSDGLELDENADDDGDWTTWVPDPAETETRPKSCASHQSTSAGNLLHPYSTGGDTTSRDSGSPTIINHPPGTPARRQRSGDIISMLAQVYGSRDLFVSEYRTLLADRLLSAHDPDTDKELRHVELLKLRFGDQALHYCEVMLKDRADSRRIAQHVKGDEEYKEPIYPFHAVVISDQFWPAFKAEQLALHPSTEAQLAAYQRSYEAFKGSRTLHWKRQLGLVDLTVEFEEKPGKMRSVPMCVTPTQATIILHFQDKDTWHLDDLSRVMKVPASVLKRKLLYWAVFGIIIESPSNPTVYILGEKYNRSKSSEARDSISGTSTSMERCSTAGDTDVAGKAVAAPYDNAYDDDDSFMASTQDQREIELQTFWSYVIGMLVNLDSLPLDRIHQMLKMFAFQGPTIECTLQELKVFLDRKVREQQLIYSGGLYKLPKPYPPAN